MRRVRWELATSDNSNVWGNLVVAAFAFTAALCGRSVDSAQSRDLGPPNEQASRFAGAAKFTGKIPAALRALTLAERKFGPNHLGSDTMLDTFTLWHLAERHYSNAETLRWPALPINAKALSANAPANSSEVNKLTLLYWALRRYGAATTVNWRAPETNETASLNYGYLDIDADLDNPTLVQWAQGRYSKAEPFEPRTPAAGRRALGQDDPAGKDLEALGAPVVRVTLPPGKKIIALTVDLCAIKKQRSRYGAEYFNTLRGLGISYTIYPSGQWMREHRQEMKQFMRDPHVRIGLHGDYHQALTLVTDRDVVKQEFDVPLAEYQKMLTELATESGGKALRTDGSLIPEKPTSMREPWGYNSAQAMEEAKANRLTIAHWSHAADGLGQMQKTMTEIIQKNQSGSILLTHGNMNTKHDANDVRAGIREAQSAGYTFETLEDMMEVRGAKPQRTVKHADLAEGSKIPDSDIYTAFAKTTAARRNAERG
jgi:peptidoglycan/xylan/chitin deacetylase (PgdA/CDA1 family)